MWGSECNHKQFEFSLSEERSRTLWKLVCHKGETDISNKRDVRKPEVAAAKRGFHEQGKQWHTCIWTVEFSRGGKYKHEMYERCREICWSGFLEEREMVEYGREGLSWEGCGTARPWYQEDYQQVRSLQWTCDNIRSFSPDSPFPHEWNASSAQYDQRTVCRRLSRLVGRPWLQPSLIPAPWCFLKYDHKSLTHLKFM